VSLLRIAIVGDFNAEKRSHWATEAALFHAAARLGEAIAPIWVPTKSLAPATVDERLAGFDAIWGAPGSPFESFEGMLLGIGFARRNDIPYLGTCAGFQYALIEFTRSVLGVHDADSAENGSTSKNIVITPIECAVPARPGAPAQSGSQVVNPVPETLLHRLCGETLSGEYFCSFETNPEFVSRWEAAGLRTSGRGPNGEMRALDLPANCFFLATLFQPQLSSSFENPHPIILGYLRAARSAAER
jgi:CTP synthase (UTP-ammonia lyase)